MRAGACAYITSTASVRNPSWTDISVRNERNSSPAPITSTNDSAICATTSALRSEPKRPPSDAARAGLLQRVRQIDA